MLYHLLCILGQMMPPVRENSTSKIKCFSCTDCFYEERPSEPKHQKKVARRVSQRLPFCSGAEGGTLKTFSFH